MKTTKILLEELKNGGLDIAEETLMQVTKIIFEKAIPRLAIEAEEPAVKSIAAVLVLAAQPVEQALFKMIDKIDGKEG